MFMRIFMYVKAQLNKKYCLGCGKLLTSKKSRDIGYGPECLRRRPSVKYKELEQEGQLRIGGDDVNQV